MEWRRDTTAKVETKRASRGMLHAGEAPSHRVVGRQARSVTEARMGLEAPKLDRIGGCSH